MSQMGHLGRAVGLAGGGAMRSASGSTMEVTGVAALFCLVAGMTSAVVLV